MGTAWEAGEGRELDTKGRGSVEQNAQEMGGGGGRVGELEPAI